MDEKTVTVEKDVVGDEGIAQVINTLLSEINTILIFIKEAIERV